MITLPKEAVVFPAASKASVLSHISWLIPAISAIPPIVLSIPKADTKIPYIAAKLKLKYMAMEVANMGMMN